MNMQFLDHSENAETESARRRRRVVAVVFILLPFLVSFSYELWAETARPWITPMDLDETLMPLSSLFIRCARAVFSGCMLLTLPMLFSGLALYRQRISISCMFFCAMSLTLFGAMLVGMFVWISFAPGAPIPEALNGLEGILLFAFTPATVLSFLLLTLGREGYVRLCALLPPAILGGFLLLQVLAS